MKLYNTLTRKIEEFKSNSPTVTMYSCGPTVYDHIHIGNLSAFITADVLRRTLITNGYVVKHVMNFTDVDDKTIKRSRERYSESDPKDALKKLTSEYEDVFLKDMEAIGNDVSSMEFIRATESIEGMRQLIRELHDDGFAYISDDGVYFSIQKYRESGKTYGQLLELTSDNTSAQRIDNDEYDKDSVHDFALWKKQKDNEPSWEFELDGRDMTGRPGWHIECSVMSVAKLGQPFDIHTGGIDLIFPHHENEIAQSTAGNGEVYATYFVHNEHLLVDGKKMSKSLANFFTLRDIQDKGFDPLSFRLMVLQSHYRSQSNFTWDNLEAAQNRLKGLRELASLRFQANAGVQGRLDADVSANLAKNISEDLNTPQALAVLSQFEGKVRDNVTITPDDIGVLTSILQDIDDLFGLQLLQTSDISDGQKAILKDRQDAKDAKDWAAADKARDELHALGIGVRDTQFGQIWYRT